MRVRLPLAVVFAAVCAAVVAPGLPGAPARPVTGFLLDGSAFDIRSFCTSGSVSVAGSFDATFIGRGTYTGTITTTGCLPVPGCCFFTSDPYPVAGTFVFTGPGGTFTASGTGTGRSSASSAHIDNYGFDLRASIVSGTGRYHRAAGSLTLHVGLATIPFSSSPTGSANGTIAGSISLSG